MNSSDAPFFLSVYQIPETYTAAAEKKLNQGARKKVPELSRLDEDTFFPSNAESGLFQQNLNNYWCLS